MTAPIGTTSSYPIPVGGAQVRITDGTNNPPAGLTLINRADNGGTVWISTGPAGGGAAVPLGPGGTMKWTDPGVLPYAYLSASSTLPETLVVTAQADSYSNPTAVAVATATQLNAQGIPSTFLGRVVFSGALALGQTVNPLDVSAYSSLVVAVKWKDPGGNPQPAALNLTFGLGGGINVVKWLTHNPAWDAGVGLADGPPIVWRMPVYGPTVSLWNLGCAASSVVIYGTNRATGQLEIVNDQPGGVALSANVPASFTAYPLTGAGITGGLTKFNGPIMAAYSLGSGQGNLSMSWVAPGANSPAVQSTTITISANNYTQMTMVHPNTCAQWQFVPFAAGQGTLQLRVHGAGS